MRATRWNRCSLTTTIQRPMRAAMAIWCVSALTTEIPTVSLSYLPGIFLRSGACLTCGGWKSEGGAARFFLHKPSRDIAYGYSANRPGALH